MCHDRIQGDLLRLTHDFMAVVLAVRRFGVTATVHSINVAGAIRATRERIVTLDRDATS